MLPSSSSPTIPSGPTGPTWEIAMLFPEQGDWTGEEYLEISERTNRVVELRDGRVEVQEMPGKTHQQIVIAFHTALQDFIRPGKVGEALVAPYPVKVSERTYREPDVVFMLTRNLARLGERFAEGADLVAEVISKDRKRDLVDKRGEYSEARIAEYWIIDPRDHHITVLVLQNGVYVERGSFGSGQRADSLLLSGFSVAVDEILGLARE
jgi:Uma2 family endonuclease